MTTLLGVDVGGTFTDLVWCDDVTGEVVVGKEPTWPDAPERGVVGAVEAALSPERVAGSSLFLHGTTVGLNALLERVPRVRAHLHHRDRRVRPPAHGAVPVTPRGCARSVRICRRVAHHALRWWCDDLRTGRGAALRDGDLGTRRGRRRDRGAR